MLINGALINIITDSADKDGLLRSRTLFHCVSVGAYEMSIIAISIESPIPSTATVPQLP